LGKGEQRRLCSRGKKKRTDNGEERETTALGIGEEGRREKKAKSLPPPLVKAAQRWRNNLTGEVERFRKGEKKKKKKKKKKGNCSQERQESFEATPNNVVLTPDLLISRSQLFSFLCVFLIPLFTL
jgi:hypothetical protein